MSLVSDLLYRAPPTDPRTGLISRPWAEWLAALLTRAGGPGEQPTNADLTALVAALTARVSGLEAQTPAPARAHLLGGPLTPPSVTAIAAGAGLGATASVAGNDNAGTISLAVQALAARRSNSEVLRLTFAVPYAQPPICTLMPANDAAWALLFGRFLKDGHAASVRLRQADVSTTAFALRVGVTSLPREAETYAWSYIVLG
jgi:hypothetical protein